MDVVGWCALGVQAGNAGVEGVRIMNWGVSEGGSCGPFVVRGRNSLNTISSFCLHSEHQRGSSHTRPDWPSGGYNLQLPRIDQIGTSDR